MSLERDLKQALERHRDDARTRANTFDAVEAKVRRAHRRRLAAVTAGGLALIAAAAIALPRLTVDDAAQDGRSFADDPPAGTSPAPSQDDGFVTLRNEQVAYQLRFPADWRVTRFEGAVELLPPEQIGLAAGEPTFAVEIMHLIGERYDERRGRWEGGFTLAGQPAVRQDIDYTDGTGSITDGRVVTYRVDWTALPCPPEAVCDSEISTLQLMVHASTQELWDRFGEDGLAAVEGLQWIRNAPMPTGEVRTPYGRISGVTYDEATSVLQRFLDARVFGDGAEEYLRADAATAYDDPDGSLGLYALAGTGDVWLSYSASLRREGENGIAIFEIELTYEGHGPAGVVEELVVAPEGRNESGIYERGGILSASYAGDFTA
jgi:hypothetical protein